MHEVTDGPVVRAEGTSTRLAAPDPETLAAIIAAIEVAWPRPTAQEAADGRPAPRWRFSGRWWSKPIPARRDRPN